MVGSAQVTADIGPGGSTGTHIPFSNITKLELDLEHEICRIYHGNSVITEVSLVGITGISTTIDGTTGSAVAFEID